MKSKQELDKLYLLIDKFVKSFFKEIIFEVSKGANIKDDDYVYSSLITLYLKNHTLISKVLANRHDHDYYSAFILLRPIFENTFVYHRLFKNNKLKELFETKDTSKYSKELKNCLIVKHGIIGFTKHYFKGDSEISDNFMYKYHRLSEYEHFNNFIPGQFKHHANGIKVNELNRFSYDNDNDNILLGILSSSLTNLFVLTYDICNKIEDVDKDKLNKLFTSYNKIVHDKLLK